MVQPPIQRFRTELQRQIQRQREKQGQRQEGQILKELPKHLKDLKWTPLIGMNLKVGPSAVKLELK